MAQLDKTVDPDQVGLDPRRLGRVGAHLDRYVTSGQLAGYSLAVSRGGQLAHVHVSGARDAERQTPVELDTIFRIYSMTKPITSVALMMLHEEGLVDLIDPVSKFLPEFSDLQVFAGGSLLRPLVKRASEPMRVWHLLTHTSGMTYGFFYKHPVDALYRAQGFEWAPPADLARSCEMWAELPLLFEPGTSWHYSHATDVVGRLVEVISGQSLDTFFTERIFAPLGMADTGFFAREDQLERLATLYSQDPGTGQAVLSPMNGIATQPPAALFGGQGLVSTLGDYLQFAQMLLGGGALDGQRILGPHTVRYMTKNHLPGNLDMVQFGTPVSVETAIGIGFGLGFSVVIDPAATKVPSSAGEFAWSGAASTTFWVDPREELTVVFMTQLMGALPIRRDLRRLVYQSLSS